jgi:hypothetical protein
MVTFGVGEAIAVAQLVVQVVEVGQKCAESIRRWQAYGEDAGQIYLKFSHENRRMKALQFVLTDRDKFGLGNPLFDLMEPQQQQDLREILLHLLQLLNGFQALVNKYNLSGSQAENRDTTALLSSALAAQALEDALPEITRRDKWLQTTTCWTTKLRWTFGAKTDAERLVSGIRQWLALIVEEIDQQFWTLAIPKPAIAITSSGNPVSNTEARLARRVAQDDKTIANFSQLSLFERDPDMITLNLASSMRIRKFVLQLQTQNPLSDQTFPSKLLLNASNIQVGKEVQHNRYIASMTKGASTREGLVEFRSYEDRPEQIQQGIKNLCMILIESKEESFRLPKPEGIFHQEGSMKRCGLFFTLSSIGAHDLESVWTLQRIISPAERGRKPSAFKTPLLEDRFKLALSLATALGKLHSVGWYHQGLQSRNVCLVLHNPGNEHSVVSFDKPFLFGFTKSRAIEEKISYEDGDVLGNLYRHPDRWEPKPSKRHDALHDLYSLGVVLLEIGLWKELPGLLSATKDPKDFDISNWKACGVQSHLRKWGEASLAQIMGTAYQKIVLALLEAKAEDTEAGSWQSWPAQKRLMYAIRGLRELCSALSVSMDTETSQYSST